MYINVYNVINSFINYKEKNLLLQSFYKVKLKLTWNEILIDTIKT